MLTPEQRRALEWIRDNDHHKAEWLLASGKRPRAKDGPEKWVIMELAGSGGSIRIPAEVMAATCDMITPIGSRTRIYGLSDAGRAALAQSST